RYRESEGGIISESKHEIHKLVNSGLQGQYQLRSSSFKAVLGSQQSHADTIQSRKKDALEEYKRSYEKTKEDVDKELEKLNGVEEKFDEIVKDADTYFQENVKKQLEYIYTPGFFDYSDWIDRRKDAIAKELENPSYDKDSYPGGYMAA